MRPNHHLHNVASDITQALFDSPDYGEAAMLVQLLCEGIDGYTQDSRETVKLIQQLIPQLEQEVTEIVWR